MKGLVELHHALQTHGWAHTPRLAPVALLADVVQAWEADVQAHPGPLMRQYNALAEPHHRSAAGFVTNSLHNPHTLDAFPAFASAIHALIAAAPLVPCAEAILGGPVHLLQTAFFDSSIGSLPHRDDHPYREDGEMVGVWIALEDIDLSAGPFLLWPQTHLLDDPTLDLLGRQVWHRRHVMAEDAGPETDALLQHLRPLLAARQAVAATIPAGDAIWWQRRTIHGSEVPAPNTRRSRRSVIVHFVRSEDCPRTDPVRQDGGRLG